MMKSELCGNTCAQQLADVLPIGVAIVNAHDEIVFANRRFHELTTSHQSIGLDCLSQSVHADDYEHIAQAYGATVHTKMATRKEYRAMGGADEWRGLSLIR
jgi:PAS domain-containing protein